MPIMFLLSAVPGEVAGSIGAAGGVAFAALWREFLKERARSEANLREFLDATHAYHQHVATNRKRRDA